jgi:ATP-dependent helicase HrpB
MKPSTTAALSSLPITPQLPALLAALTHARSAILQAPPGAGKSTAAPLALLDAPWLGELGVVMLEPRRLATRAVATRMAALRGEPVGQTIGYRSRLETRVSRDTRLTVVTEGVLTRMLQSDAALEGIGLVIFDEFHERSLNADLGLALCLDVQAHLRDDLRLLVMSATLDAAAVARLLGDDTPVISTASREFPIVTQHLPRAELKSLAQDVGRAIRRALDEGDGDLLVFLPGAPEIRRVARQLGDAALPPGVDVHPLFGDLPTGAQDAALAPAPAGRRKVVLATAIAETSLTIEGVQVVIDAGFSRRARFDPVTGMSGLVTLRVSQAAADQRRGRAGRLGPGRCYRLWPEEATRTLEAATPPEILEADLAPFALDLAAWGITNPGRLRLLDAPPAAALAQARDLLTRLGALDSEGMITPHGQRMAAFGAHPRLAHLILESVRLDAGALGCEIAAVLSERDLLRGPGGARDADLRWRLEALHGAAAPVDASVDVGARTRASRLARQWQHHLGVEQLRGPPTGDAGLLLALAYPDRIGARRGGTGRFVLAGGRGAFLADLQPLSQAEFIVAAELDAGEREARIFLAAPLERAAIDRHLGSLIETVEVIRWDGREGGVIARRERRLGAILLEESRLPAPDPALVKAALLAGLREAGLGALAWSRAATSLRERAEFVRHHLGPQEPDWPAFDDATLTAALEDWLAPWIKGVTRLEQLGRVDLHGALSARLDHAQRRRLESLAPPQLTVPSGSQIAIEYADPAAPSVAVRLQEVFGLAETPRIAAGRVPLTLKLLSPAQRPVQVTRDLASFWQRGYAEVRKELKGRYPKHYWPEDPYAAEPTHRVRPR